MYREEDKALQFCLKMIDEVKHYFIEKIREREQISKKISKYNGAFDFVDQTLLVLWTKSCVVVTTSFASDCWKIKRTS